MKARLKNFSGEKGTSAVDQGGRTEGKAIKSLARGQGGIERWRGNCRGGCEKKMERIPLKNYFPGRVKNMARVHEGERAGARRKTIMQGETLEMSNGKILEEGCPRPVNRSSGRKE